MLNQKGSVLSVAIVMIGILSFSLASLAAYTERTATSTNRVVESERASNEARRSISRAMHALEDEIHEYLHDEDGELDMEKFYDLDDHDHAIISDITEQTGATITGEEVYSDGDISIRRYTFSYPRDENRDMVRDLYLSNHGVEYEEHDTLSFSVATNGAIALNGGAYHHNLELYTPTLYTGYNTIYKNLDGEYVFEEAGDFNTPSGDEEAFFATKDYMNCSLANNCLAVDEGDIIIERDNYVEEDIEDPGQYVADVFSGFDYRSFFFETFNGYVETDTTLNEDNYTEVLENAAEEGLVGILDEDIEGGGFSLDEDLLVQSDLLIDMDEDATLELNGHSLVVLGTLDIKGVDTITQGNIFAMDGVNLENDRDLIMLANLHSYGDLIVEFDDGHGFSFDEDAHHQEDEGITLTADGNIRIEYANTPYADDHPNFPSILSVLLLSRQSIFIHASTDPFVMGGAIYALAEGPLDDVYIEQNDEREPFAGLFIASYNGALPRDGSDPSPGDGGSGNGGPGGGPPGGGPPGQGGVHPGQGSPPGGGPPGQTNDEGDHTVNIYSLEDAAFGQGKGPADRLRETFDDVPELHRIIIYPDILNTERTTYRYERRED